jgi:hypothetical protein
VWGGVDLCIERERENICVIPMPHCTQDPVFAENMVPLGQDSVGMGVGTSVGWGVGNLEGCVDNVGRTEGDEEGG